jgi:hypothetical protein
LNSTWSSLYANNGDPIGFQRFRATLTASRNQYWQPNTNVFPVNPGMYDYGVFSVWKSDLAAAKPAGTQVEVGSAFLNPNTPLP